MLKKLKYFMTYGPPQGHDIALVTNHIPNSNFLSIIFNINILQDLISKDALYTKSVMMKRMIVTQWTKAWMLRLLF